LAALADQDYLRAVRGKVAHAIAVIGGIARANGLTPLPTAANFVAIDCGRDGAYARRVLDGLIARGVFVRLPGVAPLNRCIRVSAGTDDDLAAVETLLASAAAAGVPTGRADALLQEARARRAAAVEKAAALRELLATATYLDVAAVEAAVRAARAAGAATVAAEAALADLEGDEAYADGLVAEEVEEGFDDWCCVFHRASVAHARDFDESAPRDGVGDGTTEMGRGEQIVLEGHHHGGDRDSGEVGETT
jgi:hypothetical protein